MEASLGLLAPALLPLLLLVARVCSNSQKGDPRTPELPRRCPVCAPRQAARGGNPSTPTAALWPTCRVVALLPCSCKQPGVGTPGPQEARRPTCLRAWSPTWPFGLCCFCFVFGCACAPRTQIRYLAMQSQGEAGKAVSTHRVLQNRGQTLQCLSTLMS